MSTASRLFHHLPITSLHGIGPNLASKFEKLGLVTVQDLLLHFPFRYENRAITTKIKDLVANQRTAIEGTVVHKQVVAGKRRRLICTVSDETGIIHLCFFNMKSGLAERLVIGQKINAFGEIKYSKMRMEIVHPVIKLMPERSTWICENGALTAIYYTTEGLSQTVIRKFIKQAMECMKNNQPIELIPNDLFPSLPTVFEALSTIHMPPLTTDLTQFEQGKLPAQRRLIIEELLAYQLSISLNKRTRKQKQSPYLHCNQKTIAHFIDQLPFSLTTAQHRVVSEVTSDLQSTKPMMRLLQGDVGSGKTIVAAIAALHAVSNNKQVALMVPTEILAEQHYANLKKWFASLDITIACITGKLTEKVKRAQFDLIHSGQAQIVVGTHAIFYDQVRFDSLALVIIDEQHRFGVAQRLAVWQKGQQSDCVPHQLIMTATPIPRTLSMTLYTDLAISTIDELPPGRVPVNTAVMPETKRNDIALRVKGACDAGRQVYWVCTLIEESEQLEAQAAKDLADLLQSVLSSVKIGLIHGRMKANEKETIMLQFKRGEIQLLIATTVIEVGVDVPNASLMIIENAERLGLAQLHQLRGRVGRGTIESHCILLYRPPLSNTARARLDVLRETCDGFVIAQKDMEIRGMGDIVGTKQIGGVDFKIVDLVRDHYLMKDIQRLSHYFMGNCPEHAEELIDFWLPKRQKYMNA